MSHESLPTTEGSRMGLEEIAAIQTASSEETRSLIRKLRLQLEDEQRGLEGGTRALQETLFDDPFPLLRALASSSEPSTRQDVRRSTSLISRISSPKEVVLALEELLAETQIWEDAEDDDEDCLTKAKRDHEAVVHGMIIHIQAYRESLKRLESAKLDQFYATAFSTISSTVIHLVMKGVLPTNGQSRETLPGLELVEAIFELAIQVETIKEPKQRGTAQESARSLIATIIGLLNLILALDNANDFFLTLFPRYRRPSALELSLDERARLKERISTFLFPILFTSLDYKLDDLVIDCRFSTPLKQIGSISLLSHYLAANPSTPLSLFEVDDDPATTPTFLLSATLDAIRRSQQPQMPDALADDDLLFFLWWCINQQKKYGDVQAGLGEEVLYPLIEILSSLSAMSPEGQTRFLSFRLLATLILDHTGTSQGSEMTQLRVIKDLLTENGTPAFKTACIGIVKELFEAKFVQLDKDSTFESLVLTPQILGSLGPALLRFDAPNLFDSSPVSPEQFVEEHQRDIAQKFNFCFFLLTKDKTNKTGIRSGTTIRALDDDLLGPLRTRLSRWLDPTTASNVELDPTIRLELELLEISLARVDDVLRTLA